MVTVQLADAVDALTLEARIQQRFNLTAAGVRVVVDGDVARVVFLGSSGTSLALALLALPTQEKLRWGVTGMSPIDGPTPAPPGAAGVDTSGEGRKSQLLFFFIVPVGIVLVVGAIVCFVRRERSHDAGDANENGAGSSDEATTEMQPMLLAPERSAANLR